MHNLRQYEVPLNRYTAMMDLQVIFTGFGTRKIYLRRSIVKGLSLLFIFLNNPNHIT
jgi:hypothetical protein